MEKTSRQITVWQKSDERYNLDYLTPTFKSGYTSIMVWDAFTATHKLFLIAMPPSRRIAIDFVEIAYDGVLGSILDAYCCGRNSRTKPRLELRGFLKQDQEQD